MALTDRDLAALTTTVPMDPVSLNLSLDAALEGTPYFQAWTLNSPSDSAALNVIVFDSEDPSIAGTAMATRFKRNAIYVQRRNAIAVDYQLIHELWQRFFPADETWGARSNLLGWIIGHEAGHLLEGHASSHFRMGSPLLSGRTCDGDPDEVKADAHYASVIAGWDEPWAVSGQIELFREILEVALEEPVSRAGSSLWPWKRCRHPEFVIRAYRMIDVLSRSTGDPVATSIVAEFRATLETG